MAKSSSWGSVRKLKSGNWQARYRAAPGAEQQAAPVTFPTKSMARKWLDRKHAEIITGEQVLPDNLAARRAPAAPTVREFLTVYLSDGERAGWSPNTIRTLKSRIECHILPVFGDRRVNEVTQKDVLTWWRAANFRSQNQAYNIYLSFSSLYKAVVNAGYVEKSPVKIPGATRGGKRRRDLTVATREQVEKIAANMPRELAITVILGAWCGLRFGEIAALQRRNVDLDAGVLTVTHTTRRGVGGAISVGPPKSAAGYRSIAIPAPALDALKDHMNRFTAADRDALLVTNPAKPWDYLTNKALHKAFNPACEIAGLPGFHFHDLRHTGLTMAARAGATVAELMARAGHNSPDMAMRYQHASIERDKAIAARMSELDNTF